MSKDYTVTPHNTSIQSYFEAKGFSVDIDHSNECIPPVESLAFYIAINYQYSKPFLKYIRENIPKKNFSFIFPLGVYPPAQQNTIANVADKFSDYGIISDFYYNKTANKISGKISSAPRVINFLNGDYLEYYARSVAQKVVKDIADKHNCDYEIYSNVIITKADEKHELDIVMRAGQNIFWGEIKSGKFSDFDCYRRLGLSIGVNPDKHILLSAEKDDEQTQAISWFYQFYVSNINNFKEQLTHMLEASFKEEK